MVIVAGSYLRNQRNDRRYKGRVHRSALRRFGIAEQEHDARHRTEKNVLLAQSVESAVVVINCVHHISCMTLINRESAHHVAVWPALMIPLWQIFRCYEIEE